jgi:hypothetical protein
LNIKECEKKIIKVRNNISNIDFKKIKHNILVSFVQDYVNFQITFLGIDLEEMGNYSIIKGDMVFYPNNYDKCVQKIFNMYSKYPMSEIKEKHNKNISFFVPFPDQYECLVYINSFSGFISEVAHLALILVSYYLNVPCDRMVSELYDGTMVLNFGLHLDKIRRDALVYSCLPEKIKNIAKSLTLLDPLRSNTDYLFEGASINKLENIIPDYINDIKNCVIRKDNSILNISNEQIRNYMYNEIILHHIQASYILKKYKEMNENDDYYSKLWSLVMKERKLLYKDISIFLIDKYGIAL